MFIRRTTIRRKGGAVYASHRLVCNERIGDQVRQLTLLNLGADFPLPSEQWPELVAVIQSRL